MMTLRAFSTGPETVPVATAWALADLTEAHGRQGLIARLSPQRLKVLREHALVESAVASNRIENVVIEPARAATVVFGRRVLRNRNEEEVRGYRDALRLIHERGAALPVSEPTIRTLHRLSRARTGDAGRYRTTESEIIEHLANGRTRVRFKAVPPSRVRPAMAELVRLWRRGLSERWVPPPIALAAFNLDFLCIHPFRDGNGRVSRLLLLLQTSHLGFDVGRYVSLERLIERNLDGCYEALEASSRGWHEGRHNPWPYVNYVLWILRSAYAELEDRLARVPAPRGAKRELVETAVREFPGEFTVAELDRACPDVSHETVRRVLRALKRTGRVDCLGRGPGARWRNKGTTPKKG